MSLASRLRSQRNRSTGPARKPRRLSLQGAAASRRKGAADAAMVRGVVLVVLLKAIVASEMYVERDTAGGRVRGTVLRAAGRNVEQYRGIPFAEAPIGELRFRPPRPREPWTGTLDATASTAATACPQ
ncbi:hypothetical protein V5799_010111, partial [Amblyomma americanum]